MSEENMNYYGFDENTADGDFKEMLPGIHENVSITSFTFSKPKEDSENKAIIIMFKNEAGETFSHYEFPIDVAAMKVRAKEWGRKEAELISEQFHLQGARIKHITQSFLGGNPEVKSSSWEKFGEGLVELVGDSFADQKFRIKIVYGTKDRIQFPRRTVRAFIQNMEEPNSLKISPKWDRLSPAATPQAEDEFDEKVESTSPKAAAAQILDDDGEF